MIFKVQLPMARSSIALAANQGLLYVLSMVVIGGMVGAQALGYLAISGFSQDNLLGKGVNAGHRGHRSRHHARPDGTSRRSPRAHLTCTRHTDHPAARREELGKKDAWHDDTSGCPAGHVWWLLSRSR